MAGGESQVKPEEIDELSALEAELLNELNALAEEGCTIYASTGEEPDTIADILPGLASILGKPEQVPLTGPSRVEPEPPPDEAESELNEPTVLDITALRQDADIAPVQDEAPEEDFCDSLASLLDAEKELAETVEVRLTPEDEGVEQYVEAAVAVPELEAEPPFKKETEQLGVLLDVLIAESPGLFSSAPALRETEELGSMLDELISETPGLFSTAPLAEVVAEEVSDSLTSLLDTAEQFSETVEISLTPIDEESQQEEETPGAAMPEQASPLPSASATDVFLQSNIDSILAGSPAADFFTLSAASSVFTHTPGASVFQHVQQLTRPPIDETLLLGTTLDELIECDSISTEAEELPTVQAISALPAYTDETSTLSTTLDELLAEFPGLFSAPGVTPAKQPTGGSEIYVEDFNESLASLLQISNQLTPAVEVKITDESVSEADNEKIEQEAMANLTQLSVQHALAEAAQDATAHDTAGLRYYAGMTQEQNADGDDEISFFELPKGLARRSRKGASSSKLPVAQIQVQATAATPPQVLFHVSPHGGDHGLPDIPFLLWAQTETEISLHRGGRSGEVEIRLNEIFEFRRDGTVGVLFDLVEHELHDPANVREWSEGQPSSSHRIIDNSSLLSEIKQTLRTAGPAEEFVPDADPAQFQFEPVLASRLQRGIGFVVDFVAILSLSLAASWFMILPDGFKQALASRQAAAGELFLYGGRTILLFYLVWLLTNTLLLYANGKTIGGKMLGLTVEKIGSEDLDFFTALLRALSQTTTALTLGMGVVPILGERRQTLHDMMAGTRVLEDFPFFELPEKG